jgi:hypothetical protein
MFNTPPSDRGSHEHFADFIKFVENAVIALDSLEARLGEMMNWRDLSRIVPPDLQKPFKRAAP